jgi:hypothetical protein
MGSVGDMPADGPPREVRYPPYVTPSLGGVQLLGVLAPGREGFARMERTLDRFHEAGVALIIQLGDALLPRGTARSPDIDHVRRLLRRRQQALFVCTDDLGRATNLHRAGVQGGNARTVRPNIVHLDSGFRTRLSHDEIFTVVRPRSTAPSHIDVKFERSERGGLSGRIGLAVSATPMDVTKVVRELTPMLLISVGNGRFLDKSFSQEGSRGELIKSRAIVFGDRGGQCIDHAIVHLTTGMVTLFPEPSGSAVARTQRLEGPES